MFEFIVAQCEFSISVLPPESSLDFISLFVNIFSKPAEHASNNNRFFGVASVRIDHRYQPLFFDNVMIRLRIKPGIKRECGCAEIHANTMAKGDKIGKGNLGQNRCIMFIDGFRGYRSNDEAMIIGDNQFFFTFLVFVS